MARASGRKTALISCWAGVGSLFRTGVLRRCLERLGFTSEYIYVATKAEQTSPYLGYLHGADE